MEIFIKTHTHTGDEGTPWGDPPARGGGVPPGVSPAGKPPGGAPGGDPRRGGYPREPKTRTHTHTNTHTHIKHTHTHTGGP